MSGIVSPIDFIAADSDHKFYYLSPCIGACVVEPSIAIKISHGQATSVKPWLYFISIL